MVWAFQEHFYLVPAIVVAGLAAYGAQEPKSAIAEPLNSKLLAIGILTFMAALAVMIKAVEELRRRRIRRVGKGGWEPRCREWLGASSSIHLLSPSAQASDCFTSLSQSYSISQ